ncbi:MAG: hypothetical protein LBF72_01835 [Holosporales bacterium]|nr:hypothetical protein [Holosporales bacterium]
MRHPRREKSWFSGSKCIEGREHSSSIGLLAKSQILLGCRLDEPTNFL